MAYSAAYKLRFETANRLRKKGDTKGAIRILRALVADCPKKPAAYLVIGDIFWDEGRLSRSSSAFRVATKFFPRLEIASLGLFHTLWRQRKKNAALNEMKRFQKISFCQDYKEIADEILQKA